LKETIEIKILLTDWSKIILPPLDFTLSLVMKRVIFELENYWKENNEVNDAKITNNLKWLYNAGDT